MARYESYQKREEPVYSKDFVDEIVLYELSKGIRTTASELGEAVYGNQVPFKKPRRRQTLALLISRHLHRLHNAWFIRHPYDGRLSGYVITENGRTRLRELKNKFRQ